MPSTVPESDHGRSDRFTFQSPSLAIGCFASICSDRLADELLAFSTLHPDIDIGIYEMPRGDLIPALRTGEVSLAVLPGGVVPDMRSIVLWHDRVMVAMPRGHRLETARSVPPAELCSEIFLVSRSQFGGDMHRFLARSLLPSGPTPQATIVEAALPEIIRRVARGEGLALICGGHAERLGPGIVVRPLDGPQVDFPVRAYWSDPQPGGALKGLIDSLRARSDMSEAALPPASRD